MKRTVKAWGMFHKIDSDRRGPLCPSSIRWEPGLGSAGCAAQYDLYPNQVRVTITYDDGKKAPRKATARKGRKARSA